MPIALIVILVLLLIVMFVFPKYSMWAVIAATVAVGVIYGHELSDSK